MSTVRQASFLIPYFKLFQIILVNEITKPNSKTEFTTKTENGELTDELEFIIVKWYVFALQNLFKSHLQNVLKSYCGIIL